MGPSLLCTRLPALKGIALQFSNLEQRKIDVAPPPTVRKGSSQPSLDPHIPVTMSDMHQPRAVGGFLPRPHLWLVWRTHPRLCSES